jgi:hypothetical protein
MEALLEFILHVCCQILSNYYYYSSQTEYFIYFQVRVTNLKDAADHIGEVLKRVKKEHLTRAYKIKDWYGYLSPNFVVNGIRSSKSVHLLYLHVFAENSLLFKIFL